MSDSGDTTRGEPARELFPSLVHDLAGGTSEQMQTALKDLLAPFDADHDGCVKAFAALSELVVCIENIAIATAMHADNQRLPGAQTLFEAIDQQDSGE